MKKLTLLLTLLTSVCFSQTKPDTAALKTNIDALIKAKNILLARNDISVAQAVPVINLLQQLAEADYAALDRERKKLKK